MALLVDARPRASLVAILVVTASLAIVGMPVAAQADPGTSIVAIAGGNDGLVCMLDSAGNVACYGPDFAGSTQGYAGGNAVAIAAGGHQSCILFVDGTVDCRGQVYNPVNRAYEGAIDYSGGDAVGLDAGPYSACFVLSSGNVTCVGGEWGRQEHSDGHAVDVSIGETAACVLLDTGNVDCDFDAPWGDYHGGNAVAVTTAHNHFCVLTVNGNVTCSGVTMGGSNGGALRRTDGQAMAIAGGLSPATCILLASGDVDCSGLEGTPPEAEDFLHGTAVAIDVSEYYVCIVTTANYVECYGHSLSSNFLGPPPADVGPDSDADDRLDPHDRCLGQDDRLDFDTDAVPDACDDQPLGNRDLLFFDGGGDPWAIEAGDVIVPEPYAGHVVQATDPGIGSPLTPGGGFWVAADATGNRYSGADDEVWAHDIDGLNGADMQGDVLVGMAESSSPYGHMPSSPPYGHVADASDAARDLMPGDPPFVPCFSDGNGNGVGDADEPIYLELYPCGPLEAGAVRFLRVPDYLLGTRVSDFDPDFALATQPLEVAFGWLDSNGDAMFGPSTPFNDADGDGLEDSQDNCGGFPNPGQEDFDGDGIGDACDDSDGDGSSDAGDNCPSVNNAQQTDSDGDGLGDDCDPTPYPAGFPCDDGDVGTSPDTIQEDGSCRGTLFDYDGDGRPDVYDNCQGDPNPDQLDSDGDGMGNACDGNPHEDVLVLDRSTPGVVDAGDVVLSGPKAGRVVDPTNPLVNSALASASFLPRVVDFNGDAQFNEDDELWLDDVDGHGDHRGRSGVADVYVASTSGNPFGHVGSESGNRYTLTHIGSAPAVFCYADDDDDAMPDAEEPVYLQVACGTVEVRDVRITESTAGAPGSLVGADSPDYGLPTRNDGLPSRLGFFDTNGDSSFGPVVPDDVDGDSVPGMQDNCPENANPDQLDSDGDGFGDACDASTFTPGTPCDDGDPGTEGDVIQQDGQSCRGTPVDTDDDGIPDIEDNCAATQNPSQLDGDADGAGDACDATPYRPGEPCDDGDAATRDDRIQPDGSTCRGVPDGDLDGVPDPTDNCPSLANLDQADQDGDGAGDACDPSPYEPGSPCDDGNANTTNDRIQTDGATCLGQADQDADGVPDDADNCVAEPNAAQADLDADGEGDACDGDRDGDGFDNDLESLLGTDPDGPSPGSVGTFCGPNASSTYAPKDLDGDGIPALYTNVGKSSDYTVNPDGSVSTSPHSGLCWIAGDPDDDGEQRIPSAPDVLPETTVCGPNSSSTFAPKDFDGDGVPALYTNSGKASDYTLHADGTVTAAKHVGYCWLAGDADDDGQQRVPDSPVTLPETTVCGPNASSTYAPKDLDGDGIPALYTNVGKSSDYTLHEDGSVTASPHSGLCWLAGDPDDDNVSRLPF